MMWDGSNFDAHQHHELIDAVDNQFFNKVFDNIFKYTTEFDYNELNILK